MKVVNIDGENLHSFWTIWGTSMKFSENMWLDNIKSHKKPRLHPLKKPQGRGGGRGLVKLNPPALGELWYGKIVLLLNPSSKSHVFFDCGCLKCKWSIVL